VSLTGHRRVIGSGKATGMNRSMRRWLPAILLACSSVIILAGAVTSAPASAVPAPQAKKWADQMPDGDGKKIIAAKCQLCHTLERVVTSHRTKDDWQSVIDLMVEQGAALSDDETKTVVDYLAANYSPKDAAAPAAGTTGAAPAGASGAAPAGGAAPTMIIDPDQTQFNAAPDSLGLPSGTTMATVSGDSGKPGLFSILLKFPPDQMVRPHWMSTDVDLVVLRGTFQVGNGDAFDASKLQTISPGQVLHIPAQSHQFGQSKAATVVLVYGVGPLSITWGQ
jgi:quercetin dioxygenase-like cupin family protein